MSYADLHNHNHNMIFYSLLDNRKKADEYHPWNIVFSNQKKQASGARAGSYTQSDYVKLLNGKVKLTFNALYPLEKGFVTSPDAPGSEHKTLWQKFTWLLTHHKLPLRDFMQMLIMHLPDSTIDFLQSDQYSYWEFLNKEYEFSISKDNMRTRNSLYISSFFRRLFSREAALRRRYPESLEATGTYTIPKNKNDVIKLLQKPEQIVSVLTIEGGHALGTDRYTPADWLNHIQHIKQKWQHPVFFITLAHHFDNKICGHARSFPKMPLNIKVLDQTSSINGSFTAAGKTVLNELLSLNDQLEKDPTKGYRILIDVKHMAPASRSYFYEVVNECMKKGDVIPVIASHVGYSEEDRLQDLIDLQQDAYNPDVIARKYFNFWGINICKEDVEMVVKTGGLIGLSYDQRIVGCVPGKPKPENGIGALCDNIIGIVKAAYTSQVLSEAEKSKIWNCLCIGTDFDGYIDPVNPFPTALKFREYEQMLLHYLEEDIRINNPVYLNGWSRQNDLPNNLSLLVRKLCYKNCEDFVLRFYPDKGNFV